jgi:DNA-binding NarL/FixJ family response regulator
MRAPSSHPIGGARITIDRPIRILIVGSRPKIRAGLQLLIEGRPGLTVVGETACHSRALILSGHEKPDLILLDLHVDTRKRIDGILELASESRARVLVVDDVYDINIHREAVRNGAEKLVVLGQLQAALVQTLNPETDRVAALTDREHSIIASVALGLNDKKIAARLGLAHSELRRYFKSIFTKLAVANRLDLLVYSFRNGLLGPKQTTQMVLVPPRPMALSKGRKLPNNRRSAAS